MPFFNFPENKYWFAPLHYPRKRFVIIWHFHLVMATGRCSPHSYHFTIFDFYRKNLMMDILYIIYSNVIKYNFYDLNKFVSYSIYSYLLLNKNPNIEQTSRNVQEFFVSATRFVPYCSMYFDTHSGIVY